VTTFLRHSRNLGGNPGVFAFSLVFKYCGPRLESRRGDEEAGIQRFLLREVFYPSEFLTQYSLPFKLASPGGGNCGRLCRIFIINHPHLWLGKVGNEILEQSTSKVSFVLTLGLFNNFFAIISFYLIWVSFYLGYPKYISSTNLSSSFCILSRFSSASCLFIFSANFSFCIDTA